MATIYTSESNKILNEFINEIIDVDSTVVIPDLQRPYIWNPNQVILLIDSLFKKWPFGSLLCWNVKSTNNFSDSIPYRPFWEEVVRDVPAKKSKPTSIDRSSNSHLMILDGQQRIQSLLLALGGDSWGFTLVDKDWKKIINGTDESIDNRNWSSGCLCLSIESFLSEYEKCNRKIAGIDIGKCLCWAVTDENTGLSSKDKKHVLPITSLTDGLYVRFAKIWKTAMPVGFLDHDYEDILKDTFNEISKDKLDAFIKPLSEFMTVVADVKDSTFITRLTIKDFKTSGIPQRGIYNNAIVNIFARLNTAGRALTPQEITLAWLKTGWREENDQTGDRLDCATSLENFLDEINGSEDNAGFQMSMDNLVDILSLFWIIVERNGENKNEMLLNDKDLVDGTTIKSIGSNTFKYWPVIQMAILDSKETYEIRKLNECFSRSYYAFYIICGWKFISIISSKQNEGRIRETKCRFDVQINESFDNFIDRWYFSTQLSDTWSNSDNYPGYVARLCKLHKKVVTCHEPIASIELLIGELHDIIDELKQTTVNRIRDIRAYDRKGVVAYKNILWLWNRLQSERWLEVKKPMQRLRAQPKLEVDHAIPVEIWIERIDTEYPDETSRNSTGVEVKYNLNREMYTRSELLSLINILGNCSLLIRSHNRSKGKEEFYAFLKDIYNPDQIELLKEALLLNDICLKPNMASTGDIIKELIDRTEKIKTELIEFFNNTAQKRGDGV
jgi:hypothetical protein